VNIRRLCVNDVSKEVVLPSSEKSHKSDYAEPGGNKWFENVGAVYISTQHNIPENYNFYLQNICSVSSYSKFLLQNATRLLKVSLKTYFFQNMFICKIIWILLQTTLWCFREECKSVFPRFVQLRGRVSRPSSNAHLVLCFSYLPMSDTE
jgi:hypothetical protein